MSAGNVGALVRMPRSTGLLPRCARLPFRRMRRERQRRGPIPAWGNAQGTPAQPVSKGGAYWQDNEISGSTPANQE